MADETFGTVHRILHGASGACPRTARRVREKEVEDESGNPVAVCEDCMEVKLSTLEGVPFRELQYEGGATDRTVVAIIPLLALLAVIRHPRAMLGAMSVCCEEKGPRARGGWGEGGRGGGAMG